MEGIKEVVIVSGKGGTGKTSVVASIASLIQNKVTADCDVDAANLHMILNPKAMAEIKFTGGSKAFIDLNRCTGCNVCRDVCRFGAISKEFVIDEFHCEGCGACYHMCPASAVDFTPRLAGHCYVCKTSAGEPYVYAELLPGEENSGKLVAMVRNEAKMQAEHFKKRYILIDGPPGIGCPVISSVTGTDLAIAVTEPTISGRHDLERIIGLADHFQIPVAVVVNKCDINPEHTAAIKGYCSTKGIPCIGDIPYEGMITEAQRQGLSIVEYNPECEASKIMIEISKKIISILEEKEHDSRNG